MKLAAPHLRQRDGVSCGPAVAVLAGALLDPAYGAKLTGTAGRAFFDWEQGRVHRAANRVWPRSLGLTPAGMARMLTSHGVRYRWRPVVRNALTDVERAVAAQRPVAMLIGNAIPRHWVLIIDATDGTDAIDRTWHCYEPSSGEVRTVPRAAVQGGRLTGLGFARAFALVMPAA